MSCCGGYVAGFVPSSAGQRFDSEGVFGGSGVVNVPAGATRGFTGFANVGPGGRGQVSLVHPHVQENSLVFVTFSDPDDLADRRWSYDPDLGAIVITLSGSATADDRASWFVLEF